jgi:hypothetical protein
VCGIAVEGEVEKVKTHWMFLDHWSDTAFGTSRNHTNHAIYPANSVAEAAVGIRTEGVFATTKQAAFTAYTSGTMPTNQFKVYFTLSAAGTASIILYAPSVRKY